MKHIHTNPDEAIDRVLTGLREAEPPQGMQQRVLHAATERAGARARWSSQLSLTGRHSWMAATASVAVLALAASWMIARSHRTTQDASISISHSASVDVQVAQTPIAAPSIVRPRHAVELRRPAADKQSIPAEVLSDEDALALSEMSAPSHLAPPMPLTDQERLLISLVRKGDPVELAMLDPKMRSSAFTDGKAEFERFFAESEQHKTNQPIPDTDLAPGRN